MPTHTSLPPEALYRRCDAAQFSFKTTAELNENEAGEIIGQARAVEAIRFGIGIRREGFNLFALGSNGTGKFTAVNQFLSQKAPLEPTPDDWCYVNNFEQPHKPHALRLSAGQAAVLHGAMKRLVQDLFTIIPAAFTSEEYQAKKKAIESELKEREARALESLRQQALAQKIAFVSTPTGFVFAPIRDGEVISPDTFLRLTPEEQKSIETKVAALQEGLQEIMRQLPHWLRQTQERIKQLNEEVAAYAIAPLFDDLRQRFGSLPDVLAYLQNVRVDIIDNVADFLERESSAESKQEPSLPRDSKKQLLVRYQVNVLVDHSNSEGAPVIHEDQPSYQNLVGRIEHASEMGALLTDFTLIKPGALHRANGGYLILDARKLLLQPYAWEGLKHALRAREIRTQSLGQLFSWVSTVSLEPEPIPLDVKVILTGDRLLYYLLYHYDPDFAELFKVAADFEDEMERNNASDVAYAHLIATLARKEQLRHFDREAVARVIEHSARLAGDAGKLTTHMRSVSDLLREADFWAGGAGREVVTAADVQQALDAQAHRAGRLRERIQEAILSDTVLIDTEGAAIGQINALSVIKLGEHAFGRPSRITACVRLGKGEVIDIERQVELGGPIHSKGVMILSGFLGARYAAERPFSLSATLVFEQSYSGIDGDSASSAELYALLSALAGVPIKQSMAVTGSINQRGQVQAIGGVNEKIEGFFDLCRARGLTGEQAVLIPTANIRHLMLRADVVEAVASGAFHIYPVATIDEGIEILTGLSAGQSDSAGNYPEGSFNERVVARLVALSEKQRIFSTPPNGQVEKEAPALHKQEPAAA